MTPPEQRRWHRRLSILVGCCLIASTSAMLGWLSWEGNPWAVVWLVVSFWTIGVATGASVAYAMRPNGVAKP